MVNLIEDNSCEGGSINARNYQMNNSEASVIRILSFGPLVIINGLSHLWPIILFIEQS